MSRRLLVLALVVVGLGLLPGCIPRVEAVERPTFRLLPETLALLRLDPPGVGSGTAVFGLVVEVGNPNGFALSLSDLDVGLAVGGTPAALARSSQGVNLPPHASRTLELEVTVDLNKTPDLLADLARLVAGEPTPYRLEGAATARAFGVERRFETVIAEGTLQQAVPLSAPTFRFLPEASGLRELSLHRAVVAVGVELDNATPLGYVFSAPALTLQLGGRPVASVGVTAQPLPAFSSAALSLAFELRPADLGTALVQELAGLSQGGGLDLELSGGFSLELPGLLRRDFSLPRLFGAVLR